MSDAPLVIYNGRCPICAPEIRSYRRQAEDAGIAMDFADFNEASLDHFDLSEDQAARRLHVVRDGRLVSGVDAFLVIWKALPRTRWIARLVDRPVLKPLAGWIYERILAPLLYRMHKTRERR